jgi:hypothetical protein
MKQGKSLQELAAEIERRAANKTDFIAPVGKFEMTVVEDKPVIALQNGEVKTFGINSVAHNQLAEYAGIPKAYYDRLADNDPALLATNVNRWIHDEEKQGQRRLIRVLDNKVRAVVSDKFRCLDNEQLAEAVLPVLLDQNLMILACEITERRMYIKAVDRSIEVQVPTGKAMGDGTHTIFDCCAPAITIGNSEVGMGALYIESGVWTKACTNLATFGSAMRKYHTGARADVSDDVFALLSDRTKQITDAAVWSQTRDLVKAAFDQAKFEATCKKLGQAGKVAIEGDVVEVVESVGRKLNIDGSERKGILAQLIKGGDLTQYGLHAAVTRYSADVEDFDRATELERLGGRVIDLSPADFAEVTRKAA